MNRARWHEILEGEDPEWGRVSLWLQQGSVLLAILFFSISTLPGERAWWEVVARVTIIIVFALEYALRVWSAPDRRGYVLSFWGMIDVLAFLPSLLLLPWDTSTVRAMRLLQILRVLKLARYNRAMQRMSAALAEVRDELAVALLMSSIILYLAAAGIWVFERDAQPEAFGNLFDCLWWAVATLTTVGYGDVYPITVGGRIFTTLILVLGLAVIAVPTGLITAALMRDQCEEEEEGS